jgi:hypothetical protein
VLVPRSSGTPVATWAWPIWVVSRRRVLEVVFILLEFRSPSRRIFIGSHSLPLSGSPYQSFTDYVVAHRSDRCSHRSDRYPRVRPVRPTGQTGLALLQYSLRFFVLTLWINQGTLWFSGQPPETPRTRCSLRQSPLMTRLPHSPGSTLVLRLNQETVILLFMPPCGPHLTPLATGSLERILLVFSTPGGLTGDDLSHLFFTCTNTSRAATCTCNT